MARLKTKELQQLDDNALKTKLVELKKELIMLRAQSSTGAPIKSPGMIRSIRKNIARIYTYAKKKGEKK